MRISDWSSDVFSSDLDALDHRPHRRRYLCLARLQVRVELEPGGMLAGGADHEQAPARPGALGVDLLDAIERRADVGASPAGARLGDLAVAAGPAAGRPHPNAARPPVAHFPPDR